MLGIAALALGWSWASVRGGLLGELMRGWRPQAGPGPVALWVCDRDAGAVVGLDAQALVSARFAVPSPTALLARRDGQLWVACALEGEPQGLHELWLLTQGGRTRLRHPLGPVLDLALSGDAAALTLERTAGQAPRVARIGSSGLECDLGSLPGACCIAADARGWGLVGTEAGEVLAFAPSGPGEFPRLAAQRAFGGATLERADDLAGGRAPALRRTHRLGTELADPRGEQRLDPLQLVSALMTAETGATPRPRQAAREMLSLIGVEQGGRRC